MKKINPTKYKFKLGDVILVNLPDGTFDCLYVADEKFGPNTISFVWLDNKSSEAFQKIGDFIENFETDRCEFFKLKII